jgi:hypothetical protein
VRKDDAANIVAPLAQKDDAVNTRDGNTAEPAPKRQRTSAGSAAATPTKQRLLNRSSSLLLESYSA